MRSYTSLSTVSPVTWSGLSASSRPPVWLVKIGCCISGSLGTAAASTPPDGDPASSATIDGEEQEAMSSIGHQTNRASRLVVVC